MMLFTDCFQGYAEENGCKNGYVLWPVRTAVSGKQMTPAGATEIMEVLGKGGDSEPDPKGNRAVKQLDPECTEACVDLIESK